MIDTPHLGQTTRQATAFIHLSIPRSQIQQVMGPAIQEVMATLAAQGVRPAGAVFSHHLKMDPATFDFEVGVPVTQPVAATGRVRTGELPAARVARTVYQGPYEKLGEGWGELMQWIEAHGHKPAADLWESYTLGPEANADPLTWRTELVRPLLD